MSALLEVNHLCVEFQARHGQVRALDMAEVKRGAQPYDPDGENRTVQ